MIKHSKLSMDMHLLNKKRYGQNHNIKQRYMNALFIHKSVVSLMASLPKTMTVIYRLYTGF